MHISRVSRPQRGPTLRHAMMNSASQLEHNMGCTIFALGKINPCHQALVHECCSTLLRCPAPCPPDADTEKTANGSWTVFSVVGAVDPRARVSGSHTIHP